MPAELVTPELVRRQLEKILDNPIFSQAGRLRRFLEYVVDRTLRGEAHELKEYTIGLAVFDRPEQFDPRLDPIVRVEAGRLRQKLNRYNESEIQEHAIRIQLPKGAYVPVIELLSGPAIPTPKAKPTLAILSFADLSLNRDQVYLCEGMTEELIRALTKATGLRVFRASREALPHTCWKAACGATETVCESPRSSKKSKAESTCGLRTTTISWPMSSRFKRIFRERSPLLSKCA